MIQPQFPPALDQLLCMNSAQFKISVQKFMWKIYGKVKTNTTLGCTPVQVSSCNHTTSSTVQLTALRSNISSSFLLLVKELSVISPILLLKLLLPQETRPKTKKPKQSKTKKIHKNYKFTSCCMHPLLIYGNDKFILNSLQAHVSQCQT
jgi:hypothetical protein